MRKEPPCRDEGAMQLRSLVRSRHCGSDNVCVREREREREIQCQDGKLRVLSNEGGPIANITQPQNWEAFFFRWQVQLASCPLFRVAPPVPRFSSLLQLCIGWSRSLPASILGLLHSTVHWAARLMVWGVFRFICLWSTYIQWNLQTLKCVAWDLLTEGAHACEELPRQFVDHPQCPRKLRVVPCSDYFMLWTNWVSFKFMCWSPGPHRDCIWREVLEKKH